MTYTKGYGQFCPVAVASEVLAERWTLLILRELLCGSRRFNDLHRGVPLMSASLLSQRLKELEYAGLVEKRVQPEHRGHAYMLTEAGEAVRPIVNGIGLWGLKYMRSTFEDSNLDPSLLMWDMRRWIRPDHLPDGKVVIQIDLTDARRGLQHFWLVKEPGTNDLDLCLHDPGFDVDLVVTSDVETMCRVWLADIDLESAVRTRRIELEGPSSLRMSFYDWIGLSPFAHMREDRSAVSNPEKVPA
ncbi:helix-turn-helix domain-containing protein [soil metagenome]